MASVRDVLIIGGGVIGLTSAYFLAKRGLRVTVVEAGEFGQESSWAGAGIISPGHPRRARSPLGRLRALSASMFAELSAELREQTGLDNGYWPCGGLELRRSHDALERARIETILREEQGEGATCELLEGEQLRHKEPALAETLPGAIYFPEMAQIRNPWHIRALIAACNQLHVELRAYSPVSDLVTDKHCITAAWTPQERLIADKYVICAGAWADRLLQNLGLSLGIRPMRGQIALLRTSKLILHHIIMGGEEYLVPRRDGHILIGSTVEDVGFDKRTTARAIAHLLETAIQWVPALREAELVRAWAGLRPGSPDSRPFIGRVPGYDNLYIAAGHFRSGITLSPGTALLVSELILGLVPSVPLEPFRIERLAT
ncbi:MAG: glycine oxidase ThiO [Gemmatales bacterium]|nr:glycine oxidase ThiO [Gemmatales bacterium]MDW7994730.1 glycine oxidase ThiO [Gemmatales bacterium]